MIQKIKILLATTLSVFVFMAVPVLAATTVGAQADIPGSLQCGAGLEPRTDGTCPPPAETGDDALANIAKFVVNFLSVIVGVVAVIMIIWGGARYITSGGDSGKVANAKNTIIYAVIGLIIVALAQFIVQFVLGKVSETI